jgi:hypothetical protein
LPWFQVNDSAPFLERYRICAVSNHLQQDPNCFTTLKSEIREAKRVNSKVLLRWT